MIPYSVFMMKNPLKADEQLSNGNKVHLEGLGTFGFTISSNGAESMERFSATNIKKINIIFTPDVDLENLIDDAVFEPVASRIAQAVILKAEKNNETSVISFL